MHGPGVDRVNDNRHNPTGLPRANRVKDNRHIGMSVHTSYMSELPLFFLCVGKAKPSYGVPGTPMSDKESTRLSRSMVKAHVLSLKSRGRHRATCSMGRGHLVRVTSLHAADRSGTGSSVLERTDWTCHAVMTEAVRGPVVATVRATPAPTSALTCALGFPL